MFCMRMNFMAACASIALLSQSYVTSANAACATPVPVSAADLDSFRSSPGSLLAGGESGARLVTKVRDLAASDAGTIAGIVALARPPGASSEQISAIGTGLAQAAALCVRTEEETSRAIQRAVVGSNNEALTAAFRVIAGDFTTTAVGTGGAGGGAGGGGGQGGSGVQNGSGGTGGGGSAAIAGGPSSFPNAGAGFTTSGGSTISINATNARTLRTVSGEVSATAP